MGWPCTFGFVLVLALPWCPAVATSLPGACNLFVAGQAAIMAKGKPWLFNAWPLDKSRCRCGMRTNVAQGGMDFVRGSFASFASQLYSDSILFTSFSKDPRWQKDRGLPGTSAQPRLGFAGAAVRLYRPYLARVSSRIEPQPLSLLPLGAMLSKISFIRFTHPRSM